MHPVNKGLVPIHYKYFVRNLTLTFDLLKFSVENLEMAKNKSRII